jgi:hypothetical protein
MKTTIPDNCVLISLTMQDLEHIEVEVTESLNEDSLGEEAAMMLQDLAAGIRFFLDTGPEALITIGHMINTVQALLEDDEGGIEFEPDPELLRAIEEASQGTVIPFNKKKLN